MIQSALRRPQVLIAAAIFALTLGIYTATLNPTAPFWDSGEFITTSHIVGIPHQPGTPLYVLVGRVFDILFGSADVEQASLRTAWAVNFMSAFFSSLAVVFIYLLIWELARRADPDSGPLAHLGAMVGALFLAFSETFWNNAVEAEVYGLAAFMMALLSWLAVRWYDHREQAGSNNLLLLMIYLLGLGVGFHLGSLLAYPGIFALVFLARKRILGLPDLLLMSVGLAVFLFSTTTKNNDLVVVLILGYALLVAVRAFQGHRFALLGSALFFVGLTVHVMMMIRAGASPEPAINQTDPDNFATLLSVIRREQYPPLNPFERQAPLTWQFGYYYNFLAKQFYFLGDGRDMLRQVSTGMGWFLKPGAGLLSLVTVLLVPVFLAVVGLFQGLRRLFPLVLVPLTGYLINGEVLTLYLNFTDHEVRDRDYFYFAAFMFFAVFIGLGAAALLRYLQGKEGKSAEDVSAVGGDWRKDVQLVRPAPAVMGAAALLLVAALLPIAPGHTKFFEHDNSDNRIAYEYAWNILAGLDENAILFTNGDNDTFPIWYLQMVEKFRTDVTVVNLSLVNLPWYIKQIKYGDQSVAMRRSDAEIDALRHRLYEDPKTGERQLVMVKDYVLHDIITTNLEEGNRPAFFAVTIPRENMERYFPNLQMEGMAYRLMDRPGPDNLPTTEPQKVMENMLGTYRLGSIMDGSDSDRQAEFRAMAGLAGDGGDTWLGREFGSLGDADFDTLLGMIGSERNDVFRNANAVHLLGNYPAALNRAGYEFYLQADKAAQVDTIAYRRNLNNALAAFEASLKVAPFNDQALEFYPLLLVQAYRDDEAKAFLSSLNGNVPAELEEKVIYTCLRGILGGGVTGLALEWIQEQIDAYPDRKFYYQVQFSLYQALGQKQNAAKVMEAWERRTGERDPEMVRALEQMQDRALEREQQRIEDAVEGFNDR